MATKDLHSLSIKMDTQNIRLEIYKINCKMLYFIELKVNVDFITLSVGSSWVK